MLKQTVLDSYNLSEAAAFGRLCVETNYLIQSYAMTDQPPSGGCVLKPFEQNTGISLINSRLRAAVC